MTMQTFERADMIINEMNGIIRILDNMPDEISPEFTLELRLRHPNDSITDYLCDISYEFYDIVRRSYRDRLKTLQEELENL